MFHNAIDFLEGNPNCLEILRTYSQREIPDVPEQGGETDLSWTKRIVTHSEETEQPAEEAETKTDPSSESHGLLIAYGYLDIELAGRTEGIQYRISSEGKKALAMMEKSLDKKTDDLAKSA